MVFCFGCLLVVGVILAATSVHQVPNVIQARSFQILNSDGIIVGEFASSGDSGRLGLCSIRQRQFNNGLCDIV